jgi:hypothetical protein
MEAIQSVHPGIQGKVGTLDGNHAIQNSRVAFARTDAQGDAVSGFRPGYLVEAFLPQSGIGIGGFAPFPYFNSLNFLNLLDRIRASCLHGYCDHKKDPKQPWHKISLKLRWKESSRDFRSPLLLNIHENN